MLLPLFKDQGLHAALARDGYVVLPLLDAPSMDALRAVWADFGPRVQMQGFATTTTSPDLALKEAMFRRIQAVLAPQVDAHFQDYKPLGAAFLQKDPGDAGFLPLHQDWTVTEEDHYRTYTLWIPLVDCDEAQGALQMIPGSHLWTNVLRGPNLPSALQGIADELRPDLRTLPLRAGEAVVFDHSVIHGSLPVADGQPRIAATFGLTHRQAPLRFWYRHAGDPADRMEQLAMPDDMFLRYHDIGQRPGFGQSLGYYTQSLQPFTVEEADAMRRGRSLRRPIYRDLQGKVSLHVAQPQPITRRADWNRSLAEQGFVIFPLLGPDEVAHLHDYFLTHQPQQVERFYASVHNPDLDFRLRMDAEIQRVVAPRMAALLDTGELLGGSFIAKPQGGAGILPPHADWNIVDERLGRSYNLWIPLVDTTVANGAVHVIPGSHDWLDYYRGPRITNPFEAHKAALWEAMLPLEMQAGAALLYDHRLLHASPVNQTEALRLACVIGVKPRHLPMRYYHGEQDIVCEYAARPSFFMTQSPESGPGDLPLLGIVTDHSPTISEADLDRWLGRREDAPEAPAPPPPADNRTFWQTYTPANIWREIVWRLKGRK